MDSEQTFISIGYHKGEMDFSINSLVKELSLEKMNELRIMIPVAIGVAESMWRERENSPSTTIKKF